MEFQIDFLYFMDIINNINHYISIYIEKRIHMTEEINNLNTDFKELFVENKLDELTDRLDQTDEAIVLEITEFNFEIIKKYFETEKFNLLMQYIRFVAFSSFMCEYSAKRNLVNAEVFDSMMYVFNGIYNMIQENKQQS